MIEVRNLHKVYKTKKGVTVKALDGVSLKLPETGMVFILGKSGSGKSTLLNVIGGLDKIDSGEILVKGSSCRDFKQSHYDSYRNTYIGFIFQEYNILEELTVGANIALAIELQGRRAENNEINDILREVDLEGYGARKPNELSGGQKQRVAIARALVKKPEIIMADEPTGALDSATGKQVFDTLKRLSRDKLVLIVSHDREFSEQYADRIIELSDGKVISDVELVQSGEEQVKEPEQAASLTYGEDGIKVQGGYQLTEADRLAINEYLRAHSEGVTISVASPEGVRRSSYTEKQFKPTDESRIIPKTGEFKLIKSKLSIKNAFKIGSGALKYKKFRLVFTIFLSLIAFMLFGLADTIAAYNSVDTTTSSLVDSGISYASFMKEVKSHYGDGENEFWWENNETYLSPEDMEKISEETGLKLLGVYQDKYQSLDISSNLGDGAAKDTKLILYSDTLSGLAAIDRDFVESRGFTLKGRYPEAGKDEVVITEFMYEYFKLAGYLDKADGKEYEIKTHDDLIGKKLVFNSYISDQTIVGIVDTGFDLSRYEPLTDENAMNTMNPLVYMALLSELESARAYSYACLLFVDEGVITDLAEENKNNAERFNGHINIYLESNKVEDKEGYIWYTNQLYFDHLQSLEKYNGSVTWLEGEKTSLADNEIIIPARMIFDLLPSVDNQKLWDEGALTGFELTLKEEGYAWNLQDVLFNIERCAAIKYATENTEAAREKLKKAGYEYHGADKDIIRYYSDYAWDVQFLEKLGLSHIGEEYFEELVSKYKLERMVVSEEIINLLVASKTVSGETVSSLEKGNFSSLRLLENLRSQAHDIIARKYAIENYSDAVRFAEAYYELPGGKWGANEVVNRYTEYLRGYIGKPNGFTPTAKESFDDFACRHYMEIYKALSSSDELITMEWSSYMTGRGESVEGIKLVGVVNTNDNGKEGSRFIILGDKTVSELLGANRGGIFRFAIGNMPEGESGVHGVVEFSKFEIDGEYRFSLKNSVTEELAFVEDILSVLGQVFLYVGIAFAVFASLMLTNFIGTSISYKKHDIGILRAIGSRSADVFRIFFAESFIIAMINFTLSAIGTFVLSFLINSILRDSAGLLITFLSFGIRQILLLLAVSLLVAFVATFFPVRKIARKKPIDAIKNL